MTYFTETTRGRRIVAAIDHHTDKIEGAAFELYEDRWCANRKTLHRLTGTMKWADQDVVVLSLAILVECVHASRGACGSAQQPQRRRAGLHALHRGQGVT